MLASRVTLGIWGCLLGCLTLAGGPSEARAEATPSTAVSSNWAGYVAQPTAAAGSRFTGVSGTWIVPSVTCVKGRTSYSAVWVGLGGYREAASALEQVGVDADCSRAGRAIYASWFELLPAPPITLQLKVRPGDHLSASVTSRGHIVTLRLRNLTTSTHFNATRRVTRVDRSSAEWIVEAPSECSSLQACSTLALSDFGDVAFTSANASAHGHTGPLSDALWSLTGLELHQGTAAQAKSQTAPAGEQVLATPSAPGLSDGAFVVGWRAEVGPQAPGTAPRPASREGPASGPVGRVSRQ